MLVRDIESNTPTISISSILKGEGIARKVNNFWVVDIPGLLYSYYIWVNIVTIELLKEGF